MALSCIISEIKRILVENRDFFILHLHSMPRYGGIRRNIVIRFGMERLEWFGYQTVKKFDDI